MSVIPEVLEVLLAGKLNRVSIRAAIIDELSRRESPEVNRCASCMYLSDKSERPRCDLHGRGTLPSNYCSWWRAK